MKKYEGQAILVAIGLDGRGCVLGYRGEGVYPAITDDDPRGKLLGTDEIFPLAGYPKRAGIYVWRGEVEIDWSPDGEPDIALDGSFWTASDLEVIDLIGEQEPAPIHDADDDR